MQSYLGQGAAWTVGVVVLSAAVAAQTPTPAAPGAPASGPAVAAPTYSPSR